jgi:hypothetical protein
LQQALFFTLHLFFQALTNAREIVSIAQGSKSCVNVLSSFYLPLGRPPWAAHAIQGVLLPWNDYGMMDRRQLTRSPSAGIFFAVVLSMHLSSFRACEALAVKLSVSLSFLLSWFPLVVGVFLP